MDMHEDEAMKSISQRPKANSSLGRIMIELAAMKKNSEAVPNGRLSGAGS